MAAALLSNPAVEDHIPMPPSPIDSRFPPPAQSARAGAGAAADADADANAGAGTGARLPHAHSQPAPLPTSSSLPAPLDHSSQPHFAPAAPDSAYRPFSHHQHHQHHQPPSDPLDQDGLYPAATTTATTTITTTPTITTAPQHAPWQRVSLVSVTRARAPPGAAVTAVIRIAADGYDGLLAADGYGYGYGYADGYGYPGELAVRIGGCACVRLDARVSPAGQPERIVAVRFLVPAGDEDGVDEDDTGAGGDTSDGSQLAAGRRRRRLADGTHPLSIRISGQEYQLGQFTVASGAGPELDAASAATARPLKRKQQFDPGHASARTFRPTPVSVSRQQSQQSQHQHQTQHGGGAVSLVGYNTPKTPSLTLPCSYHVPAPAEAIGSSAGTTTTTTTATATDADADTTINATGTAPPGQLYTLSRLPEETVVSAAAYGRASYPAYGPIGSIQQPLQQTYMAHALSLPGPSLSLPGPEVPLSAPLHRPPLPNMISSFPSTPSLFGHHHQHSHHPHHSLDIAASTKAKLVLNNISTVHLQWLADGRPGPRCLVKFNRSQSGSAIAVDCQLVPEGVKHGRGVLSCLWWAEKKECYVTSVDVISILEFLVNGHDSDVPFAVEEKNRIRRNMESLQPITVSKSKPDQEAFFKQIMACPDPKPRNIEKDIKVFPWPKLEKALRKVFDKYTIVNAKLVRPNANGNFLKGNPRGLADYHASQHHPADLSVSAPAPTTAFDGPRRLDPDRRAYTFHMGLTDSHYHTHLPPPPQHHQQQQQQQQHHLTLNPYSSIQQHRPSPHQHHLHSSVPPPPLSAPASITEHSRFVPATGWNTSPPPPPPAPVSDGDANDCAGNAAAYPVYPPATGAVQYEQELDPAVVAAAIHPDPYGRAVQMQPAAAAVAGFFKLDQLDEPVPGGSLGGGGGGSSAAGTGSASQHGAGVYSTPSPSNAWPSAAPVQIDAAQHHHQHQHHQLQTVVDGGTADSSAGAVYAVVPHDYHQY